MKKYKVECNVEKENKQWTLHDPKCTCNGYGYFFYIANEDEVPNNGYINNYKIIESYEIDDREKKVLDIVLKRVSKIS